MDARIKKWFHPSMRSVELESPSVLMCRRRLGPLQIGNRSLTARKGKGGGLPARGKDRAAPGPVCFLPSFRCGQPG